MKLLVKLVFFVNTYVSLNSFCGSSEPIKTALRLALGSQPTCWETLISIAVSSLDVWGSGRTGLTEVSVLGGLVELRLRQDRWTLLTDGRSSFTGTSTPRRSPSSVRSAARASVSPGLWPSTRRYTCRWRNWSPARSNSELDGTGTLEQQRAKTTGVKEQLDSSFLSLFTSAVGGGQPPGGNTSTARAALVLALALSCVDQKK